MEALPGGGLDWIQAELSRADLEALLSGIPDDFEVLTTGFHLRLPEPGSGQTVRLLDEEQHLLHSGKRFSVLVDAWFAASAGGRLPEVRRLLSRPEVSARSLKDTFPGGLLDE